MFRYTHSILSVLYPWCVPYRTVLCPGLGTAVGRMPVLRCAVQMRVAYEAVMFKSVEAINRPIGLSDCCTHHVHLYQVPQLYVHAHYIILA